MSEAQDERTARWRAEEAEEEARPAFVFRMDGIAHFRGGDGCACGAERPCPKCGGFLHTQGVYGGYVKRCEQCDYCDE